MGKRLDRALLVCLWLVRALCVVVGLAVVAGVVHVLLSRQPEFPTRTPVTEEIDSSPPPTAPPAPEARAAPAANDVPRCEAQSPADRQR